jgi:hypothetical protein
MKYDTSISEEAVLASTQLRKLLEKQAVVEIKEVRKGRTRKQNAYLHLLLADFGMQFGYTVEEAKQLFKALSPDIFKYERDSKLGALVFWLSTADVDTKQMSDAIEKFKNYSALAGHKLPDATDEAWLRSIENMIDGQREFL